MKVGIKEEIMTCPYLIMGNAQTPIETELDTEMNCKLKADNPNAQEIMTGFFQEFGFSTPGSSGGNECPFNEEGNFENCPFQNKSMQVSYQIFPE
ncbi:hypothetical protein ACFL35_19820 [Candidatus Riflebacteria bacterium]